MHQTIDQWLMGFGLHEELHDQVVDVLLALPSAVLDDLMHDPSFMMADYEPRAGVVMQVRVKRPGSKGPSRSVVLKRTLLKRPGDFVRYIIAHELAHAHLRNGGRWPGDDPEQAADALAMGWGFPKPGV